MSVLITPETKVLLTFDESAIADECGNTWTAYNNPTIGTTNAKQGKALQITQNTQYLAMSGGIELGGQDFSIDGWAYVSSSSNSWPVIFSLSKALGSSARNNRIQLSMSSSTGKLALAINTTEPTDTVNRYNSLFHYAVLYSHNEGRLILRINGQVAITQSITIPRKTYEYVYVGYDTNIQASGVIGAFDNFRITDGVCLWTADFDPETAIITTDGSCIIRFDTSRQLSNVAYKWRYENPGTTDLLLEDHSEHNILATVQVDETISKYGTAFYRAKETGVMQFDTSQRCFDIPATDEIWIKFDAYVEVSPNETSTITFFAYSVSSTTTYGGDPAFIGFSSNPNYNGSVVRLDTVNDNSGSYIENVAIPNVLQTYMLHMKSGISDGVLEIYVDGELVESFNGNVNKGETFDNIQLYSFKNTVYFSNVIISNGSIALDEMVMPAPIKIFSDTERSVQNFIPVDILFDTSRELSNSAYVWRYENYGISDLLTVVGTTVQVDRAKSKYETAFYQTQQVKCFDIPATKEIWIKFDVYFNGTNRWRAYDVGTNKAGVSGICSQTSQKLSLFVNETNRGDYSGVAAKNTLQTYLLHMVSDSTNGIVEYWLNGTYGHSYTGNVNNGNDFSNIYLQSDGAGTFFSNVIISNGEIGLNENCRVPVNFLSDTLCSTIQSFSQIYDTVRSVIRPIVSQVDTKRTLVNSFDVFHDAVRSLSKTENYSFDTKLVYPRTVIGSVEESGYTKWVTEQGIQSISISMSAQQLSDKILIVTTSDYGDIGDVFRGSYYNYDFSQVISDVSIRGILKTCTCMEDIDALLYTPMNYEIEGDEVIFVPYKDARIDREEGTVSIIARNPNGYGTGRNPIDGTTEWVEFDIAEFTYIVTPIRRHMSSIADQLGKELIYLANDYPSTMEVEQKGVTYADLISSLFGWLSILPHMLINCYIRADKIYVIQRGFEKNTIDLTNTEHNIIETRRNVERTIWSAEGNFTISPDRPVKKHYHKDYFVERWIKRNDGENSKANYQLDSDGLVASKEIINDDGSRVNVTYSYSTINGRKFLESETEEIHNAQNVLQSRRVTNYTPLYSGQKAADVYVDDEYQGSAVGRGIDEDRLNGKTYDIIRDKVGEKDQDVEFVVPGRATGTSTNFPVFGLEVITELGNQLQWLNRRIRETLILQIENYTHVIDFVDRILFKGNTYFLESNSVQKTDSIVNRQTVTLVRWY